MHKAARGGSALSGKDQAQQWPVMQGLWLHWLMGWRPADQVVLKHVMHVMQQHASS